MKYILEKDTLVINENGERVVIPSKVEIVVEKQFPTIVNKDVYNAGPCPTCGLFACRTWRHTGAPVACINEHMWFPNTQIIAKSEHSKLKL